MSNASPPADFRASFKENDVEARVDSWFFRPLAELLVEVLAKTTIRPNQVSFASALAGVASGLCYWQFTFPFIVAGGLFLAVSVVLDAADGQLARRTGQGSEIGKLFDNVMDPVKATAAMFGIAFGMDAAGSWGAWPQIPEWLSLTQAIWGLGWFAGISLPIQVMTRNAWVDRYHAYGKGRTSLTMADMQIVRVEMQALRKREGLWLEKAVVPIILAFSKKDAAPKKVALAHPRYVERMRPFIRWWTLFGGGQQFFVLLIVSCIGMPLLGWLYIALVANVIYMVLFALTLRAHRQELARGEAA